MIRAEINIELLTFVMQGLVRGDCLRQREAANIIFLSWYALYCPFRFPSTALPKLDSSFKSGLAYNK